MHGICKTCEGLIKTVDAKGGNGWGHVSKHDWAGKPHKAAPAQTPAGRIRRVKAKRP